MNDTLQINGNIATFEAELIEEGSFGSYPIGTFKNEMTFLVCPQPVPTEATWASITWNYGEDAPDEDETMIGLTFEGKELVDFDGIMSMPDEAVALLESLGYNCDYVKD